MAKRVLWISGGAVLLLAVGVGLLGEGRSQEQRRRDCAAALTSSYGTSTLAYTDRKAYNEHVREKCSGLSINGKSVVQ